MSKPYFVTNTFNIRLVKRIDPKGTIYNLRGIDIKTGTIIECPETVEIDTMIDLEAWNIARYFFVEDEIVEVTETKDDKMDDTKFASDHIVIVKIHDCWGNYN